MAEKKHICFTLLKILQEETDENHTLTTQELLSRLNQRLGLDLERRTLYSNIDTLRKAGYEISDFKGNRKGYYLETRQFEKGEILLLCNAIHASHYISQKQSDELIDKLLSVLSVHQRKEFRESVYMPNRLKSDNKALFYNIEIISEAIRDGQKISFTYLRYTSDKKPVPRREAPYIVEPRYIVYQDSRPYLISTNPKYEGYGHYRIDKMINIRLIDEPVSRLSRSRTQEAYQYAENKLFMFAGETQWVSFRCEERIMDQMIDIFGSELKVIPAENNSFITTIRTTESGAIFLAQQFIDALEITEPASLRHKMQQIIQASEKKYE